MGIEFDSDVLKLLMITNNIPFYLIKLIRCFIKKISIVLNRLLKVKEKSVEYFAFHNHIAIDNTLELCNMELKSI